MAQLIRITESTFARRVLAASLPVVVRFGSPACAASRAITPLLERLASTYADQLLVGTITVDTAPLLVDQCMVAATPTLAIFDHGEIVTRVVGFAQEGLLRLLFDQIAQGNLSPDSIWSPTEQVFEDVVIVPLLQAWGSTYQRQVPCSLGLPGARGRGRIDFLVYDGAATQPLTLFENKRLILSSRDLQQAAAQAHSYARALGLSSFVVSAPSGMWVYRSDGMRAICVQALTSLEVHRDPRGILQLLIQLQPRF
jgi:thiol-disulfide isomerase/thioredoxin